MFCLPVCMCTTCVPGALGGQKRASDPLGLELQVLSFMCMLEIKSRFLGEQHMFLTPEPTL